MTISDSLTLFPSPMTNIQDPHFPWQFPALIEKTLVIQASPWTCQFWTFHSCYTSASLLTKVAEMSKAPSWLWIGKFSNGQASNQFLAEGPSKYLFQNNVGSSFITPTFKVRFNLNTTWCGVIFLKKQPPEYDCHLAIKLITNSCLDQQHNSG